METVITAIIAVIIFFLQRWLYTKYAFRNLTYKCTFSADEVSEGEIFYITEEIENRKSLPLPMVSTILNVGDGIRFVGLNDAKLEKPAVFGFSTIGAYKKMTKTWRAVAAMRGRYRIDYVTVGIRDLLGFTTVTDDCETNAEILILPSAYNVSGQLPLPDLAHGVTLSRYGYYADPLAVRKIAEYTYSEPFNKINWKASAKSQTLMVNFEQPSITNKIVVALNIRSNKEDNDRRLKYKGFIENSIKVCATLPDLLKSDASVKFISNGICGNYSPLEINLEDSLTETREFNLSGEHIWYLRMLAELEFCGEYEISELLRLYAEQNMIRRGDILAIVTPYVDANLVRLHEYVTARGIAAVFLQSASYEPPDADIPIYFI